MKVKATKAFYYKGKTVEEGKTAIVDAKTGKYLLENKLASTVETPKESEDSTEKPAK